MKRRNALWIAIAAALGALAIAALPALAGAKDDHGRGHDHHGEHHHHHDNGRHNGAVGKISAFDSATGQLTIAKLGGGGTISGVVTAETEIKCEGADERAASRSRDSGEEEPGDDHGGRDEGANCGTADLTVGTVVHDIDRNVVNGVVSFEEIELGQTR